MTARPDVEGAADAETSRVRTNRTCGPFVGYFMTVKSGKRASRMTHRKASGTSNSPKAMIWLSRRNVCALTMTRVATL